MECDHVRSTHDEDDGCAQPAVERHTQRCQWPERQCEEDGVKGQAGAVQGHLRRVIVVVVHVLPALERAPELVQRMADKSGQDTEDDQIDGLQHEQALDHEIKGQSGDGKYAAVEEQDRHAHPEGHGRIQPHGANDALFPPGRQLQ